MGECGIKFGACLVPFAGKERREIEIGEAYFQVAKADIPFIVRLMLMR